MHCRTESPAQGNGNERLENRSLQRSRELGIITSFTVLESHFPVTGGHHAGRPRCMGAIYPRRMGGCRRRLPLHRAAPAPAAVASLPHCYRPPLPPSPAAAAPGCSSPRGAAAPALRETFAGYPAFLAPGSRKKPDPVALKSFSVGNRGRSTDPAARRSGPNSKHRSKPPERSPTIAAGQKIQDLGRSVARRALHVRRSSAPQCVAQLAGAWAAFPPPDAHS